MSMFVTLVRYSVGMRNIEHDVLALVAYGFIIFQYKNIVPEVTKTHYLSSFNNTVHYAQ
jgi:hypothetical protein